MNPGFTARHERSSETERAERYWDRAANLYDPWMTIFDRLLLGDGRAWLTSGASGDVLEIGVGTGRNLGLYPPGAHGNRHRSQPADARARTPTGHQGRARHRPARWRCATTGLPVRELRRRRIQPRAVLDPGRSSRGTGSEARPAARWAPSAARARPEPVPRRPCRSVARRSLHVPAALRPSASQAARSALPRGLRDRGGAPLEAWSRRAGSGHEARVGTGANRPSPRTSYVSGTWRPAQPSATTLGVAGERVAACGV